MTRALNKKTLTDAQLILELRDGTHTAYTEIYDRYYYLIYIFAYKKLRDEEQAKDVVQELFTELWIKKDKVPNTDNLAGYLIISTRNKIFNLFEHLNVESKYVESLKNYVNTGIIAHTDYLVREQQLQDYINKQIQSLPKKMRQIFELSRKEDLSNKKIAEKLNTTESNVSQHLANAVKILRTKLSAIFFLNF